MSKKMKNRKVKWVVIICCILLVAGVGSVIFWQNRKKESVSAGEQRQSTLKLEKMDLTESISATGTIESGKSKSISASVNNIQVEKVHVAVGEQVKKGDTLVSFDESDLQESLTDAQENLSDAQEEKSASVSSAASKLSDARETYTEEKTKLAKKVSDAKKALTEAKSQFLPE